MLSVYAAGSDVSKLAIPDDGGDVMRANVEWLFRWIRCE